MNRAILLSFSLLVGISAYAATPQELIQSYSKIAAAGRAGFIASAPRGASLFGQKFGKSTDMPSCTACHTANPVSAGQHVVTGKAIKPLAPASESTRFSNLDKVEKWFRRNCTEVIGRECTAGEKADFVSYLAEAK